MPRWHLFEFEDQPWFPDLLRDGATAYLTTMTQVWRVFDAVGPRVERLLRHAEEPRIVDLCSGAGGPARSLADYFVALGEPVAVHCTDLFPNRRGLAHSASRSIGPLTWSAEPVDATAVPGDLRGARTLFNAFHHFPPEQARRVLADAVAQRQPIGVFEFVGRDPRLLAGVLLLPVAVWAALPFCRPFRWSWIPWTYLLPVLPAMVAWDGFVSCLRVYSVPELRELTEGLDEFTWEIGTTRLSFGMGAGTWLLGYPKRDARGDQAETGVVAS